MDHRGVKNGFASGATKWQKVDFFDNFMNRGSCDGRRPKITVYLYMEWDFLVPLFHHKSFYFFFLIVCSDLLNVYDNISECTAGPSISELSKIVGFLGAKTDL